ncbi:hypothetical protein ASD83_19830 [Devosia sp. Root685]|nr:hypothetical protein ASD83_19830 [Devosia sp. Root685]
MHGLIYKLAGAGAIGGAGVACFGMCHHPLPSSPIKGEVPAGGLGETLPHTRCNTSPLMGEDGRG